MRATLSTLFAVACLTACDHRLDVLLNPQPDGLLDGLNGSLRIYEVDASFECPGRVLAGGVPSTRWPDACTDAAMEPLVRATPESTEGATLVRVVAVAGSTPMEPIGELAPGRYAFVYEGTQRCDVAALGCAVVDFPANVEISIAPPVPTPGALCLSGCEVTRDTSGCAPCGP